MSGRAPTSLQYYIPPTANGTGIEAEAINAAIDSNWIDCHGMSQVSIFIDYDRAAGTGYTFKISTAARKNVSTQAPELIAAYAIGTKAADDQTVVYEPRIFERVVSVDEVMRFDVPLNAAFFRIEDLLASGSPTTSDKATVVVLLGQGVL